MSHSIEKALSGLPEIMYGGRDKDPRLTESTADVLRFFQRWAAEIRNIPILQRIASGQADTRTWINYLVPRLQDANAASAQAGTMTQFEKFLKTLAQAAQHKGHTSAASALNENFAEETGLVNSVIHPQEAHATWRKDFKDKIFEALRMRGVSENDLAPRPPTEESEAYRFFLDFFMRDAERGEVCQAYGAVTMLELCLQQEFDAVSRGLLRSFPEITTQDARYVHHHAGHEERHFRELFQAIVRSVTSEGTYNPIHGTIGIIGGGHLLATAKESVLRSYERL